MDHSATIATTQYDGRLYLENKFVIFTALRDIEIGRNYLLITMMIVKIY
jgi:hypothetical protein